MMHINLQPLYDLLNSAMSELLQGLAVFVAGWLMYAFHRYAAPIIGARLEAKAAADLNIALQNGVKIALNQMQAWETSHKNVAVQGAVQQFAAQYAIDHVSDAVARFGLSPDQLATKALAFLPPPAMAAVPVVQLAAPPPPAKGS